MLQSTPTYKSIPQHNTTIKYFSCFFVCIFSHNKYHTRSLIYLYEFEWLPSPRSSYFREGDINISNKEDLLCSMQRIYIIYGSQASKDKHRNVTLFSIDFSRLSEANITCIYAFTLRWPGFLYHSLWYVLLLTLCGCVCMLRNRKL